MFLAAPAAGLSTAKDADGSSSCHRGHGATEGARQAQMNNLTAGSDMMTMPSYDAAGSDMLTMPSYGVTDEAAGDFNTAAVVSSGNVPFATGGDRGFSHGVAAAEEGMLRQCNKDENGKVHRALLDRHCFVFES